MKKYFLLLAAGLLLSCSSDDSNDDNGGSSVIEETAQVYKLDSDNRYVPPTEKSTISGKVYMVEERDNNGEFIYADSTMLEIGEIKNGELTLNLPKDVDSSFLSGGTPPPGATLPPGYSVKPLDAKAFIYIDNFHIKYETGNIDDNLVYAKLEKKDGKRIEHFMELYYFTENTEITGIRESEDSYIALIRNFNIKAKKGWNKIYVKRVRSDKDIDFGEEYSEIQDTLNIFYTTDLDEVPDGLHWLEM